jgi:hypothetical protein
VCFRTIVPIVLVSLCLAPAALAAEAPATQPKHAGAYVGYTLIAPMNSTAMYLIDMDGRTVHTWTGSYPPGLSTYLLENGNLLRSATRGGAGARLGAPGGRGGLAGGAGAGGRIQEIAWDGQLVWDFLYATDKQLPHHDLTRLPNGNVLVLAWDAKTAEESIAAGRNPQYQRSGGELPPDCILEIAPEGKTGGRVVWEWHVWDHLIQDFDKDKPNYGPVAEHPELIDINYSESWMDPAPAGGRGGFGGLAGGGRIPTTDWTHLNAIAYNAARDEIIVTSYTFSELWVIDHSTTTAEAAGHTGGRRGRGGDLLYRWGNPEAYRAGTGADQKLFCPHNAHWIDPGLPGAGNVLVFNNGPNRPGNERYSEVLELRLPLDYAGNYRRDGKRFADPQILWSYTAPNKTDFYSTNISGAQRLPNGNTLICSGANGRLFEVTAARETVWRFTVPAPAAGRGAAGGPGGGFGGGFGGGVQIFRAYRYGPDFPGLAGKALPPAAGG